MNRIALLVGLLLTASFAFGQTSLATVTGTITDATGAVVASTPVTLRNLDNGQIYSRPILRALLRPTSHILGFFEGPSVATGRLEHDVADDLADTVFNDDGIAPRR